MISIFATISNRSEETSASLDAEQQKITIAENKQKTKKHKTTANQILSRFLARGFVTD